MSLANAKVGVSVDRVAFVSQQQTIQFSWPPGESTKSICNLLPNAGSVR